ncbi:putative quinol monooxygenase [Avibacterium endocarditidis]|uniref:Antibiotic biosynthesis monooxygenase n=1 Tax=Avibacterium endocarditidis TaxID=380674 RepID=A0ABX4ZUR6_9PAST|nr:antibiotic biosynthesis monooxygenase [Avibacterium endocarditidis]POY42407.1 antibiotic biosynthesis monooxygenase [Avibacterium endocarditidis]
MKKIMTAFALSASLSVQAAPIMNFFELGIAEGQNADYEKVAEYNIQTSLKNEKGTLAMYAVQPSEQPDMAYMIEIYADDAAYQTHRESPQYQAFLAQSPTILTDHKVFTPLVPQFLGDKKVQATAPYRTNLVMVEVKPQHNADFKRIVSQEMAQSLETENGVLAMYAATYQNQPNKWLFFEIYADDAAYQAHRQTPHFQAYLKDTAAMLESKDYRTVQPLYLGNQGGVSWTAR